VGLDANLLGRLSDPENWERSRGLPSSIELARHLSRKFAYPLSDTPDLARIAQYSIASDQLADLDDEISNIFVDATRKPTALHTMIADIALKVAEEGKKESSTFLHCVKDSLLTRFIVVTTGYDNLFESAFIDRVRNFHVLSYTARGTDKGRFLHVEYADSKPSSTPVVISSPNDYNGMADNNPIILKLPGTVETSSPSFAISEDDFFDYLTNRELTRLLPSVITGKLKKSSLLFLGYSVMSGICAHYCIVFGKITRHIANPGPS
jgi:hypothetical protein